MQGYNIKLDSVPVDGRITLRTPMERLEDMRSEPQPDLQAKLQAEQQAVQEQQQPERQEPEPQQPAQRLAEQEIER